MKEKDEEKRGRKERAAISLVWKICSGAIDKDIAQASKKCNIIYIYIYMRWQNG